MSFREYCDWFRAYSQRLPGACAFVYAIQAGEDGPVKIGVTQNPAERLATLQQGNAEHLRGIAAWYAPKIIEKALHQAYAHARIRGEWFKPDPELLEVVEWWGGCFCDWEAA